MSNNWFFHTSKLKSWFFYIDENNQAKFKDLIEKTLDYRLSFSNQEKISIVKYLRFLKLSMEYKYHRLSNNRPLIKDPIAFFSAEWISKSFDCKVIVTVRHPAPFIASLKVKNWKFDFNNFLDQKNLMNKLKPFNEEIQIISRSKNSSIIDQGILLWKIFTYQTNQYMEEHSNWIFVRHMDLVNNPEKNFKQIIRYCDLEYTKTTKNFLKKTISSKNPKEVMTSSNIYRDTNSILTLWKERLTTSEILKIRNSVDEYYYYFYEDDDWS